MKRYIKCSNSTNGKSLVDAIRMIIWSTLAMGDSIDEPAEYLAELAGYDYDYSEMDGYDLCDAALTILVNDKSSELVDFMNYYFTEDDLIIVLVENSIHNEELVSAIKLFYDAIGSFPGGNAVRNNIETNIFNSPIYLGMDATNIGYDIGHTYWQYVTAKEYGVKSNTCYTVGSGTVEDGYVYTFGKDISSYYFRNEYPNQSIPSFCGFEFKVRSEGEGAVVDAYLNIAYSKEGSGYSQHANGDLVESWIVPNGNSDTIDKVSHDIAQWLDSNVEFAIQNGVEFYQSFI